MDSEASISGEQLSLMGCRNTMRASIEITIQQRGCEDSITFSNGGGQLVQWWLNSMFPIFLPAMGCPSKFLGSPMKTILSLLLSIACLHAADAPSRFGRPSTNAAPVAGFNKGVFVPLDHEVFVWVGSENSVIEQDQSWVETYLVTALQSAGKQALVRHMGWEGDTVYRQNRMENWGSWRENLAAVDATTVLVWYGSMEALQTGKTTQDFIFAYEKLLDELSQQTKRLVLITPPPFETPASLLIPDQTSRNTVLQAYVRELRALAVRRNLVLIDLFTPLLNRPPNSPRLTRDGVHLNANGLKEIAPFFLKAMGLNPAPKVQEQIRVAISEKNQIWFDTWRPMNWAFAYGDRTTQPFAKGIPQERPSFEEELKKWRPRLDHQDATIHALLSGTPLPAALPAEPARSDPPGISPEEEKTHLKLRDGFSIDLFASETNGVIRPIQMRWDERGRLWVVCAPSYPQLQPGEKPNDFILVLEDTDGDGRADRSYRFAEGLKMPMGLEFGPDGVFVCESTKLVYLRDTDGDGRADEKTILMSGFGTGDSHQNINSIRWGADGHLWFTQGYHIWSYVETATGIVELNRSGIWRLDPRTLKLESYLNENAAGLNCWGATFDDHGQVFHASGADFSVWHTTPGLIPTLHPLSLGDGFARSKGKCTEPEFLGSSHLPDDLQGVLLKSIYFTSQIGLYRLRDDGAGFASEDLGDLVSSSSPEFRPLETRVGPDGAIYICDWFNPVIGHYQASYRDPRRDRSHGRIWRMTANDRKLLVRPKLETMSASELIQQLHSPERWNRDQAKFLLYRKEATTVLSAMKHQVNPAVDSEAFLYELSGVLTAHEISDARYIDRFLKSDDFRWRAWGAHLVGLWSARLPDPLSYLSQSINDTHPRVRMEAVVAASTVPTSEAMKLATLVLDSPMDPSIEHSLTLCIHQLAPQWREDLASGKLDFGDRYDALARVLSTAGDTNVVDRMRGILKSGKATGPSREKLLAVLVEFGTATDLKLALREAPDAEPVLNAIVTVAERNMDRADAAVVGQLLQSNSARARIAGCKLAAAWNNDFSQLSRIKQMVTGTTVPEERQAAIVTLAKLKGREAWSEIVPLTRDTNTQVRLAALTALARVDAKATAHEAAQVLLSAKTPPEAGVVLAPFQNIKNGASLLTEAITATPPSVASAKAALQWMAQSGLDHPALLQALRKAAQLTGSQTEYSEAVVKHLVSEALASGDAASGARLIRNGEMSCLSCHRIGSDGPEHPLGPDLSSISRAMTPEMIVESVLWPKRQVKEGFLLTEITLKDGTQWSGFKASETRTELKLRGVDGTETRLLKSNIQQRTDAGTIMPDGLTDTLSHQERLDLLKYLIALGK